MTGEESAREMAAALGAALTMMKQIESSLRQLRGVYPPEVLAMIRILHPGFSAVGETATRVAGMMKKHL